MVAYLNRIAKGKCFFADLHGHPTAGPHERGGGAIREVADWLECHGLQAEPHAQRAVLRPCQAAHGPPDGSPGHCLYTVDGTHP